MSTESSLNEIIASQDELIREAALALPHEFSRCTYSLGPIRQAVYLCITCASPRGICSSCSIACHTDHEQIELFPKRNFRCDCPTSTITHSCTLHKSLEEENSSNEYGQNYQGVFCRCGRPYDVKTERETMIQCLSCEDWFHESCLNLRERPSSREPSPEPATNTEAQDEDDGLSDASSPNLPPPLISASDYDSFICSSCVSSIDTLKRYAGTPGVLMVVRDEDTAPWKMIGGHSTDDTLENGSSLDVDDTGSTSASVGTKRPRSASLSNDSVTKKPRTSPSPALPTSCLAPPCNPVATKVFEGRTSTNIDSSLGTGDIFLTEGWRERWCRCSCCLPSLESHPYLLEEEETYEPPEDPDSGLSLEELGMRALERLPRDRAIDGIRAFNDMRDDLIKYLRPFAQQGKVVNDADVKSFFETLKESTRHGRE
ncbi:hypothetical protein SERLA73DRAFT_114653 [Serpula lacrymans var. lacrymans S7.3]|uniref:UBR-type domain-containing protein n=2 Tax=Serpula lacrymans var. lacrymans TaxID=341189 RepID=F8QB41_SERL3|nr:uncharacterized protein SERLADRAFT_453235 [Serpula lacrymans var. lacrymans S7.9]EGN94427.1 hypothetical protein SERLA73DRAFT_114653 [Serpula lacrymans var. lacrymans S7.3]EGO19909.1 hypothetical protein SERLADRAFT_453235 [Serpula lacrymans var. lacrymans S7.9]